MAGVAYYTIAGKQVGGHYVAGHGLVGLPLRRCQVCHLWQLQQAQRHRRSPDQRLQLRRGRLHQELPRAAGQEELSGGRIEDDGLAVLRTRCIFISHGDMSCSSSRTADFRYQQKPSQPLAA